MTRDSFFYSATEPAVRAVTALLAAGRAHPDAVDDLIGFLGSIATSVVALRDDDYFAALVPDLAAAMAEAYPVVLPTLRSTSPEDALMLAECLVAMARIPLLAGHREQLAVLIGELRSQGPPESRPDWVRLLASLAVDVRADLDDADPAVRLRAALACEPDPADGRAAGVAAGAGRQPGPLGSDERHRRAGLHAGRPAVRP